MKQHVAVLMGGPSAEHDVSVRSGQAAVAALRRAGMLVSPVEFRDGEPQLPRGTEVAFLALHGKYGEDGTVQRLLERLGIPYTGSGIEASARAFDKAASKEAFVLAGIQTPNYVVVERDMRPLANLPMPVVVKPSRQGSSVGVTLVHDRAKLNLAIEHAWRYDDRLVVEELVAGRELTVGVLDGMPLPVVEIRSKGKFFDFESKYSPGGAEEIVPAKLDTLTTVRAQDLALAAHECLGCRDFSRTDMILSDEGTLHVLEVNTLPGLTEASLLPKAAAAAGLNMEALCTRMVELALARRPVAVAA
jgi:D-alanine-D-alanine ligase